LAAGRVTEEKSSEARGALQTEQGLSADLNLWVRHRLLACNLPLSAAEEVAAPAGGSAKHTIHFSRKVRVNNNSLQSERPRARSSSLGRVKTSGAPSRLSTGCWGLFLRPSGATFSLPIRHLILLTRLHPLVAVRVSAAVAHAFAYCTAHSAGDVGMTTNICEGLRKVRVSDFEGTTSLRDHQSVCTLRSRSSSVGIGTGCGLDDRGIAVRVPVRSTIFPYWLWGPPATLIYNQYRGLFLRR
jgi:hypothetical protein